MFIFTFCERPHTLGAMVVCSGSLYKYKCLWGIGDKDRDLSFQEKVSHKYIHKLS